MIPVTRLNHAVLFVRELDRAVDFYRRAFGFEEIAREGGMMAFLRAPGSSNHHDLGLMAVGPNAPRPPRGSVGLYHLAWEVPTIDDLASGAETLGELGALTGASDHGATKSLYGHDPDGNEFEVMWMVPREAWGEHERRAIVAPLNLEQELARWGTKSRARA
jgi:catechol-2,3-dioxygenase